MSKEEVPGVDIAPGATVTLKTKKLGANMESDSSDNLIVKGLTMEEFMDLFVPTGKEYDEYVKENGVVKASDKLPSFSYEGLMGGCGTRIIFDGKAGNLQYNSEGSSLDMLDQQRGLNLVSYDAESGKIVLQVYDSYEKITGNLVGTLKNECVTERELF